MKKTIVTSFICLACLSIHVPASAEPTAANASQNRERRAERETRFLMRMQDDLRGLLSLADREIAELQREKDAVALLESPVRGNDIDDFINWYYGFADFLKEKQAEVESDLNQVATSRMPMEENWSRRMAALAKKFKAFEKELEKKAAGFDKEQKRLAEIIDRRRLLQDDSSNLEARLARVEKKQAERQSHDHEDEINRLRSRLSVVQTELLSLPLIDEDILKHYWNLSERAQGEADWMQAKNNEYTLLKEIIPQSGDGSANQQRMRQTYEREIGRIQRRIDTIDRKRSQITPAGSIRQVERSAELYTFYVDQKQRYQDYISRLRIQLDSWLADLAEGQ